jgi:hypothetical protein
MEFNLFKVPQFLDNAVTPPAKEIGQVLGNLFYLIFSPINYNVEKLKIKHATNLKKYQSNIQDELNKIPEENLTEPPMNIVGPALEASKFYIENEEIRKMFAKLIASSMNVDLINLSHPSFIEIIKQLTLVEANIIKQIATNTFLPYVELFYRGSNENPTFFPIIEPYTKVQNLNTDYSIVASSIKNLHRLGLIHFSDINFSGSESYIETLLNDNIFSSYHELQLHLKENNLHLQNGELKLQSGNILLTAYGLRFSKVCL